MAKKAVAEVEAPVAPSVVEQVLALEDPVTAEARAWPEGPNSDALKYTLRGVSKAISSFRNALETNASLERP